MRHQVLQRFDLSPGVVLLRFTREGMLFRAGQHITVAPADANEAREYSIASGEEDPWLEILIRVVNGGRVSPRLAMLEPGSQVEVNGPCGFFTPEFLDTRRVLLATGTGAAPFRSFVRSGKGSHAVLAHGVRYAAETGWFDDWPAGRYLPCVSQEDGVNFRGRVTDWLRNQENLDTAAEYWLCGNFAMIQEGWDMLKARGVPEENLHTEVYF